MVKINKIKIDGLYSYQLSQEINLGENNIIVGPNDSGKSSILKALKYMIDCVAVNERDRDTPWNKYAEYALISLDLELTQIERRFLVNLFSIRAYDEHRNEFQLINYRNELQLLQRLEKVKFSMIWKPTDISNNRYNFNCTLEIPGLGFTVKSENYSSGGYIHIHKKYDTRDKDNPYLSLTDIIDSINWETVTQKELSDKFVEESQSKILVEEAPSHEMFSDTPKASRREVFAPNRVRIENIFGMSKITPQHGQKYSFFHLFGNLLKNRINFVSENRIFLEANSLEKNDLADDSKNLQSFLFWLQHSKNKFDKELFSKIQTIFSEVLKSQNLSFETILTEKIVETKDEYDWGPKKIIPDKVTIQFLEKIKDTQNRYEFNSVGAGVRECLFLITKCLASRQTIIALDEPALNLHPSQINMLMKKLSIENSRLKENKNQFIIITHSPVLANLNTLTEMNEIIRVKKKLGSSRVTQPSIDDKNWLSENLATFHLLKSDVLFAKVVVLVEGISDQMFLETILKHEIDNPNIPNDSLLILEVGGAKSFPKFQKFLSMFEIPYLILADNDVQNRFDKNEINLINEILEIDDSKKIFVLKDKNLEAYLSRIDSKLFEETNKKYERKQEVAYYFINKLLEQGIPEKIEPMIRLLKQTNNYI